MLVAVVNLIGSGVAFAALAFVSCHVRAVRWGLLPVMVLTGIYHASFYWLVAHIDRAAEWSQAMRPVGATFWLALAVAAWAIFDATRKLRKATDGDLDFLRELSEIILDD